MSYSDRISKLNNSSQLKNEKKQAPSQLIVKNNQSLKRVSKHNILRASYITRLVNTEDVNSKSPKFVFQNQKDTKRPNKQNHISFEKQTFSTNYLKVQLNEGDNKRQRKSKIWQYSQTGFQDNFILKSPITERSTNKCVNFIDRHLSIKKQTVEQQAKQSYRKFDITKLDFSSGTNTSKQQISIQTVTKQKQYSSLVSKSRSNIKKIIELNRFLKENTIQDKNQTQNIDVEDFVKDIQILEKIKAGCFGAVYKARMISNGKILAIKSVPYDRKNHQREEQICKIVNNPFIVKIHQVYFSTDGSQFQSTKTKNAQRNVNQSYSNTFTHERNESLTKKSVKVLAKFPTKQRIQLPNDQDGKEVDLNDEMKKRTLNRMKPTKVDQKYNEFHRVINIAMDLYDCDLSDYIMMKQKIDNLTLKLFCYQMLRSVLYLHSHQICHRDIKPQNFLVKKHLIVLSDFGSAKIMKNHKNSNISYICSRYYRAPQLIFGYKYYDKSIDMWSLGCVMAELSIGKPIFKGANSLDQLVKIIRVLGQPNWRQLSFLIEKIPKLPEMESKGLRHIFPEQTSHLFIDLLENMLVYNPLQRITAGEALCHPYFDQIRDQMNFQEICKQMDISHFLKFNRDQLKQNQHLKNKLIPLWVSQTQKAETKSNNFFHS